MCLESQDHGTAGHLIDFASTERESAAIDRFMALSNIHTNFQVALGLQPSFYWCLVRCETPLLAANIRGEIDMVLGGLAWKNPGRLTSHRFHELQKYPNWHPDLHWQSAANLEAAQGGVVWPPTTDHLVGVEAKTSYFLPNREPIGRVVGKIGANKFSSRYQKEMSKQAKRLMIMGFDRAVLLTMVANPPADARSSHAWMQSSATSSDSATLMRKLVELQPDALPHSVGHWLWSLGAVAGRHEGWQGSGRPEELRPALPNPLLKLHGNAAKHREAMTRRLHHLFEHLPAPRQFPVFLSYCQQCQTVHRYKNISEAVVDCPRTLQPERATSGKL